jgi:DNA-binding NarL/FixJ family response regulator
MKVLIVDRSELIIERLQQMLLEDERISAAYGAISYNDGARFFYEIEPEAVLLDSGMPCNECISLLKLVKEQKPYSIVIVLSNYEDDELKEKCKSLGADFFFDKYHEFEKIPAALMSRISDRKEMINGK